MMHFYMQDLHTAVIAVFQHVCVCVCVCVATLVFVLDILRTSVWSFSNLDLYASANKRQQSHCDFQSFVCLFIHLLLVR